MVKKNIINNACADIKLLYIVTYFSVFIYCIPGADNSILIIIDNPVPISADIKPYIIYNTPISFADVLHIHLNIFFIFIGF